LAKTSQLDKALSDFEEAGRRGFGRAYYNLGLVYKDKGNYDEAIRFLKMFIILQEIPDSSDAYFPLGEAYAMKGDPEAAIQNYSKSIQVKPDQIDVYYSRGESYVKTRDKEKAINDFLTFLKSPTTQPRLYQARQYLEELGFEPPIDYLQIYLHYNKTVSTEMVDQVKIALKEKRFNKVSSISADTDLASIRYFQKPFRNYAVEIGEIVKGVFASKNDPQKFPVNKFPDQRAKDVYGWIEVWLPASRPPVSPPPVPKP
jgi:tetratricopeptide (TPR) repeat protein